MAAHQVSHAATLPQARGLFFVGKQNAATSRPPGSAIFHSLRPAEAKKTSGRLLEFAKLIDEVNQ
jgi:hypothetical protein